MTDAQPTGSNRLPCINLDSGYKTLQSELPEVGRLVLINIPNVIKFAGRLTLVGYIFPWPYWEIAGTEGERLRKASASDLWIYWPDIRESNAQTTGEPEGRLRCVDLLGNTEKDPV